MPQAGEHIAEVQCKRAYGEQKRKDSGGFGKIQGSHCSGRSFDAASKSYVGMGGLVTPECEQDGFVATCEDSMVSVAPQMCIVRNEFESNCRQT